MPRVSEGNRTSPSELRELYERSGLRAGSFAKLLGLPRTTFLDMLKPHGCGPTLAVLNGARFVLLCLGHPVEIRPINPAGLRFRRRTSK